MEKTVAEFKFPAPKDFPRLKVMGTQRVYVDDDGKATPLEPIQWHGDKK